MNFRPRISVIVPIYNVEKYLDECITSLISQTVDFDEIILVNDGSNDNSLAICESYCKRFPEIILINQNNQGLSTARNVGIDNASGEYVIFVDSDDYVRKEMVAVIKQALLVKQVDVLYYNADIQYDILSSEREDAFRHVEEIDNCYISGMEYLERVFPMKYTASACVAAYNKSFLEKNNIMFPMGMYFEDNFFSLQVMSNAKVVSGIPDSLYVRRCRENSIMTSYMTEKKCRDLVINQELMWKYIIVHPDWKNWTELLKRFISFGVIYTFGNLSEYRSEKVSINLKHKLLQLFFRYWFDLFRKDYNSLEINLTIFLIFKELQKENKKIKVEEFITEYLDVEMWVYQELERRKVKLRKILFEKLSELPFREKNTRVGIYGIGKHTQILLDMYQREVGEIQSDLFFIVSERSEQQKFLNKQIYNYTEIPDNVDKIIISSYIYQEEMYKRLMEQKIKKYKIYMFYIDTSVCDLIKISWILDY